MPHHHIASLSFMLLLSCFAGFPCIGQERCTRESSDTVRERFDLFPVKSAEDIPYRIPAVATASDGNIIAVADYRHSRTDIGMSNDPIDLRFRIGNGNGKSWSAIMTLAKGQGRNAQDPLFTGFGDPCIVADRESGNVLIISCAGNVGFQEGTRERHLEIVAFRSTDCGRTWTGPEKITEQIYRLFDGCRRGPAQSLFIGSGKIHQSRFIRTGKYWRIYCAVLVLDRNRDKCNHVLYSDDFGYTWNVLGDADRPPVGTAGDEPKAEELPDGRPFISSRTWGGRIFNVFSWETGKWDRDAFSGKENDGIIAAENSCNGEILVIPAVRQTDMAHVWIVLQSVPTGPGRTNVGIYFRELPDGLSSGDLAMNWDGPYLSSHTGSAYSTMSLLSDGGIAFVTEESTYPSNGGYNIVFQNLTLEEITSDRYSYRPFSNNLGH